MRHDKHHIGWEAEHPSLELLRQYHADALPAPKSHRVERHLLGCELCADILEGMVLSNADKTEAAVEELHQRIATRVESGRRRTIPITGWQVAAAVLVLLCTTFVVVYYNFRNLQQEPRNIAAQQETQVTDSAEPPAPAERLTEPGAVNDVASPPIAVAPPPIVDEELLPLIKRDTEVMEGVLAEASVVEEEAEEKQNVAPGALQDMDTLPKVTVPLPAAATSAIASPDRLADAPAAPESTRVSMTLQGKVAGVAIRGSSSLLKKEDATSRVVTGQVLSEEGQPLPGVTVQLKGTGTGTTTDEKGHYALPVSGKKPTLLFNYIGYATAQKDVQAGTAQVNVDMAPDLRALNEVVVVGYGEARQSKAPAVISAKPAAGQRAYKKYLRENLRTTPDSKVGRGSVVVGFTVSAAGELTDVKVLKSLCTACDAEAVRLVKEGPRWQPATQAGTAVPQQMEVAVPFK